MALSKIFVTDLDGNLFNIPTQIYFEEKQNDGSRKIISVTEQTISRNPKQYFHNPKYRYLDNHEESSFQNFRDYFSRNPQHPGPDGLINDLQNAWENNNFAASFDRFKKDALIKAELFATLTARGHSPDNLKRSFFRLNEQILTQKEKQTQIQNIKNNFKLDNLSDTELLEYYFNINGYLPVNNVEWCKSTGIKRDQPTHIKKTLAMQWWLEYVRKLFIEMEDWDLYEALSL
ncbi:MAG: hypothetical protein GXP45_02575 [bacterium]|nr:hypothetical protein [bacterium]